MSFVRPSRVVHSLLLLSVFGCSGKDPEPVPEATLPEICEQDSDCDDGLFCNGEEECRSTDEGKSCFFGEPPCAEKQDCDERDTQCVTNCELTTDADGDGSIAQECGGADCDDGDSNRYPGNTELCDDGHDEDCDPCTVGERTARDGDKDRDGHLSAACTNTFDPDGVIPSCPIDEVNLRGAEGIVAGRDCNDDNDAIRPGANETCNGVDDDCDGELDDG